MLAVHLDNLLFLLFVAIAIFFQILTRAASKAGRRSGRIQPRSTPPSQRTPPPTEEPAETDEERIRKFMEALGQPAGSRPPEPMPRPRYQKPVLLPHVPPFASPLPPLKTRPPESEPNQRSRRPIRLPEQIPPTRHARTFQPTVAEAPAFEVHDVDAPLQTSPMIKTAAEAYAMATQPAIQAAEKKPGIITMLRSTSGLREAIILREVFGPPRSLQPLDLVGSV